MNDFEPCESYKVGLFSDYGPSAHNILPNLNVKDINKVFYKQNRVMPSIVYAGVRYIQARHTIRCRKCLETIESNDIHDFKLCSCV